jgi:hypothetical protein
MAPLIKVSNPCHYFGFLVGFVWSLQFVHCGGGLLCLLLLVEVLLFLVTCLFLDSSVFFFFFYNLVCFEFSFSLVACLLLPRCLMSFHWLIKNEKKKKNSMVKVHVARIL